MFALRSPKQGIVGSRQRGALVSKSVQVKAGSKKNRSCGQERRSCFGAQVAPSRCVSRWVWARSLQTVVLTPQLSHSFHHPRTLSHMILHSLSFTHPVETTKACVWNTLRQSLSKCLLYWPYQQKPGYWALTSDCTVLNLSFVTYLLSGLP